MTGRYRPPEPLAADHAVSAFERRSREQTEWLRRHARQSASTGTTRVFVVTEVDRAPVVACYAWCMASLTISASPQRLRRLPGLSNDIGCRGLLVHAGSTAARNVYLHRIRNSSQFHGRAPPRSPANPRALTRGRGVAPRGRWDRLAAMRALLLGLLLVVLSPLAPAQEGWVDAADGAGKFAFSHPPGWEVEAWEKGGRRGTKAKPPKDDPFHGGLFGVEYYADPAVGAKLTTEKLAKIFQDYYGGQKAQAIGEAQEVEVDGAPGIAQRFALVVERPVDGQPVAFELEYRVICVKKGGVAYVVNLGAESRILAANEETCRELLARVRLTP